MPQIPEYVAHRCGRTGAVTEVLTVTVAVVAKLLVVAHLAQHLMWNTEVYQTAQLVLVVHNMDAVLDSDSQIVFHSLTVKQFLSQLLVVVGHLAPLAKPVTVDILF